MIQTMINALFGCRHRRITRPITPVNKIAPNSQETYVACLDCGRQFIYDVSVMRMGAEISRPAVSDSHSHIHTSA